jgi:hypothetical protein
MRLCSPQLILLADSSAQLVISLVHKRRMQFNPKAREAQQEAAARIT